MKVSKFEMIFNTLLARLTDFELITKDEKLLHELEELREYLVKFKKGDQCENLNQ